MSAKRKSSGKNNQADPNLEANKDVELEKKVDAMMSVEESREAAPKEGKPELPSEPEPTPAESALSAEPKETPPVSPAGAPLLPTDKLPDLENPQPGPEPVQSQPAAEYKPTPVKLAEPENAIQPPSAEERALNDDLELENARTSQAVDEIMAADSDELLGKSAEPRLKKEPVAAKPKRSRLRNFFGSNFFRLFVVFLLFAGIGTAAATPSSRYYALNAAGVRSSSSVTVLDDSTGQPLKNADFSIAGASGKTDEQGSARLENLKLGPATMKINKPAFADVNQPVTVGWGSNPLGDFRLEAVGIQYKFKTVDFLSSKPVNEVEASSGEASAVSNDRGEIVLTLPKTDKEQVEIELKAEGYRIEKVTLGIDQTEVNEIQIVPYKSHVFISKRSGTYDLYKVDVDGKNEEKVLPGNGSEQLETMSLSTHPAKNMAALVSARDNIRNNDGYNLSTLTLVDLSDNSTIKVTQSERIQMIGWSGDKLVYLKVAEGSNGGSVDRHRLVSYDMESESENELASSNYFNDILAVKGSVYYTPAAYNVNGSVGLFKINIDGSDKKKVYDKEVWNILRSSYDKLNVSMGQEWFELNLSDDVLSRLDGPPAAQKTRIYAEGPNNGSSLWVDDRDGQGTLLGYNHSSKEDKAIQSQAGLKNPVRWLSSKHIIYRVNNSQETADYVLNTEGGAARKIGNVTDTPALDRLYYY